MIVSAPIRVLAISSPSPISNSTVREISDLDKLSGAKLKEQRYEKFRAMGKVEEVASEQEQ